VDFSTTKSFALRPLGEAGRLEFRAEFFNLFNRANFGVPSRLVFASNTGEITQTITDARQIQLALKIVF
jgi:hypothetical protein